MSGGYFGNYANPASVAAGSRPYGNQVNQNDYGNYAYDYPNYDDAALKQEIMKNRYLAHQKLIRPPILSRDDYGHHDTYYHDSGCYEEGVSIALLLTTFLGILIMGYTLYTKIVANGGRKRREADSNFLLSELPLIVVNGMLNKTEEASR